MTIARFRARHETALADFLVQSLRLCAAAGMVRVGVVALDGTKVAANAADRANRTLAKLQEEVTQILREPAETDQASTSRDRIVAAGPAMVHQPLAVLEEGSQCPARSGSY